MDALPADRTKVDVHRSFEDGDFSVAHADYVLGDWGPMVGFEVHRWENDRIVEHWDNLQPTPASANPSGRSMTDGATAVEDAHRTFENKALVEQFTAAVLIGGETSALPAFFDGDILIQHSPAYADGVAALREQLGNTRYIRMHRVLGQGSLVLVMSEGRDGDQSTSLYDLYRVAGGRIAEHWTWSRPFRRVRRGRTRTANFEAANRRRISMSNQSTTEDDYAPAAGRGPEQTVVHTSAAGLRVGNVEIPARDRTIPAYFARPGAGSKHPVILVVSEAFGLHEHIRDVARRFAHEGYLAVAPDLLIRQGEPRDFTDIGELVNKLLLQIPDEQVMTDLDATLAWAAAEGGDTNKVGLTGFCWGGRWTWLYAARNALGAAVVWYGFVDGVSSGVFRPDDAKFPSHPIDVAAAMQTPVLGLYGGHDEAIALDTVETMRARLREGNASARQCEIVVYPDAGHAFFADYRDSFIADAAADGWRRCTAWMHDRLKA